MKRLVERRDCNTMIITTVFGNLPEPVHETTDDNETPTHRGSKPGCPNIERGESTWVDGYIKPNSIYHNEMFARRFEIPKALYMRLVSELQEASLERW